MNVFVSGASGFVGGHVVRTLKQQHKIFAMARSERSQKVVAELGAKPVRCDLDSVKAEHLAACDAVVHCAAYAEEWGTEQAFHSANVLGTEHLLAAARGAGVKRFIHIGTEAALFRGQDLVNVNETYPLAFDSPYPYSRTKAAAERLVLSANAAEFQALSVRPRMVWGPGDQSILPAILQMIRSGKFLWIGSEDLRTSNTHVANLCHAISLALTKGVGGNAYFVSDDANVSLKDFLTRYVATQGVEAPRKSIPRPIARMGARTVEGLWKVLGLKAKPPLIRFSVDMMSAHCTVDIAKAKAELGYRPVCSIEEGLASMPRL